MKATFFSRLQSIAVESSRLRSRISGSRSASLREAFTLIEMLVVVAMLGLMMGSAASGISQAKRQAKVTRAHAEMRELVNAWLAYEQAYDDWPVPSGAEGEEGIAATESNLKELIGQGGDGMVYLNAPMTDGSDGRAFRDPWGTPYRYRIVEIATSDSQDDNKFEASIAFPNRHMNWR